MKIGFTLPQMGPIAAETAGIKRFAIEAERLGADSRWTGDRLPAPTNPTVGYGGGDTIPAAFRQALDPFALMSLAAAVTDRAEIGVNVLNAPWYPPAVPARSLTTIDRISEGGLLPGFGVGWSPEEYTAAGVAMRERGARPDECLDVLDAWWSTNPVAYDGRYTTVPATYVDLKPVRRPPIYLAGFVPAALHRVALRGDGWLPVHVPDRGTFDPASLTEPLGRIREIAREGGRDFKDFGTVLRVYPTGRRVAGLGPRRPRTRRPARRRRARLRGADELGHLRRRRPRRRRPGAAGGARLNQAAHTARRPPDEL